MESSEVVLTGGTFNSCVTNNIAIFSTSTEVSSNDLKKLHDSSSVPKLSLSPTHLQPFIPIIPTDIPTLFSTYLMNRSYNWINHGERWRMLDLSLKSVDQEEKNEPDNFGRMYVF